MGLFNRKSKKEQYEQNELAHNDIFANAFGESADEEYNLVDSEHKAINKPPHHKGGRKHYGDEQQGEWLEKITPWEKRKGHVHAPHALTMDELLGNPDAEQGLPVETAHEEDFIPHTATAVEMPKRRTESISMSKHVYSPAAQTLYQKMMQQRAKDQALPRVGSSDEKPLEAAISIQNGLESDALADENAAGQAVYDLYEKPQKETKEQQKQQIDSSVLRESESMPEKPAHWTPPQSSAFSEDSGTLLSRMQSFIDTPAGAESATLSSRNIEDIIKRAEQRAKSQIAEKYGDRPDTDDVLTEDLSKGQAIPDSDIAFNESAPVESDLENTDTNEKNAETANAENLSAPAKPSGRVVRPVRVTPLRKSRYFSSSEDGGKAASQLDARPIHVEISPMAQDDAYPVMLSDSGVPESPVESIPMGSETLDVPKKPKTKVTPYASQYSLADDELPGGDRIYGKPKPARQEDINSSSHTPAVYQTPDDTKAEDIIAEYEQPDSAPLLESIKTPSNDTRVAADAYSAKTTDTSVNMAAKPKAAERSVSSALGEFARKAAESDAEELKSLPLNYLAVTDKSIPDAAAHHTIQFNLSGGIGTAGIGDNSPDITYDDTSWDVDDLLKDNDWEEQFEKSRKKSAKKFVLFGDDEDENSYDEMPPDFKKPEEEIEDYETAADAPSVRADLKSRSAGLKARLVPTFLITAVLFLLSSPVFSAFRQSSLTAYLVTNILLVIAAALINLNTMKGLAGIVKGYRDMDAPAALAVIAVLIQSVCVMATGSGETAPALGALAALALTAGGIGKLAIISRIRGNFEVIADDGPKHAVCLLDDPSITSPLAGASVIGEALICSSRKTVNAKNFLRHSYSGDPYERIIPKLVIAAAVLAVIAGVITGFATGEFMQGITLFTAILCIACPPSSLLLCNLPLKMAGKSLNRQGAMLTGYESAEELSYANAITMECSDLFPAGTIKLYNMHMLSANPIDRSILEAAAVLRKSGSPISNVFDEMIVGGTESLPLVDAVTYEDKMGVSGWFGKKRILIGNRTLMEAHGVNMPSLEVDKKILRGGYFPLYLATDGMPAALFVIGYEADEEIAYQLERLANTGVTILIHSTDPNVGESMVCDYFGLYEDSVKIISPAAAPLLAERTTPLQDADAPAAYKGSVGGFAALLTSAIHLKSIINISTALQIVGMVLGIALCLYFIFTGQPALIAALPIGIYQLICTVITSLVPVFKKP